MANASDSAVTARIGTTLAEKYKLTRLLGQGGMGAVFEGTNTWTERKVAIKLMLTGSGAVDPELAQRFMREARAATKIAHENIVQILDMGQDAADGSLYIVQEFLTGTDLRHVLDKRGAISPKDTVEILAPVMSALIAAHKHSIVHRDLKPDNIFLTKSSSGATVPKLIDFGIAKMDDAGQGRGLTRTGAAMGTPHYMSPEQARGEKSIDAQADIWAIGVVLFEMLSGSMPYDGDNYNQLMVKIATELPRRIEEVAPGIAPSLAAVVHRALERDRTQRFRTMQQFLGALLDARPEGDATWNHTLRAAYKDVLEAADSGEYAQTTPAAMAVADDATTRRNPQPVVPEPAIPAHSTLGRTGREIDASPRTARATPRWVMGGVAGLVVAGVAVGGLLSSRRTPGSTSTAPRSVPSTPMLAPASPPIAPPAPAPPPATFLVSVVAEPSTAHIELDHERLPGNTVTRSLPRNGVEHLLLVTAEGYEPFSHRFTDAAPPPTVTLPRVIRGRAPIAPVRPVPRTTAAAATPTPQPPEQPTTPALHPPAARANGAPIGEE